MRQAVLDPVPQMDFTLNIERGGVPLPGTPLHIQTGGWEGSVDSVQGARVSGHARNQRAPGSDVAVVAYAGGRVLSSATACAEDDGRFTLVLPEAPDKSGDAITLGIAGSDFILENGTLALKAPRPTRKLRFGAHLVDALHIRIKISAPNLREAPLWGDYHFALAMCHSFERLGYLANVDTGDKWYGPANDDADVVLSLRGRHRFKTDPAKINILWLISHPDRIPDEEFADYDHVAVASDIYAAHLEARGLASVSVLHQAVDARRFKGDPDAKRRRECLFVGNSRREYRNMVRWCLEEDIPLALYGGGWEGILPRTLLRGTGVDNADLPGLYLRHLVLLNDHWDSMRANGFLSNRLFDGSAVGTPIISDPVLGLSDVFHDTISTAQSGEELAHEVQRCFDDPGPYLERAAAARDIVLGAHTFDHRAATLAELIRKLRVQKL
ncbi:MAG: glycosyltransferase [Pseudomonadota bacterium]